MAQTPEGKVKAAVKKILKEYDVWYFMPMQNGMGVVGIPDIIACWKGRFIGIETKAPGKQKAVTPNQRMQLSLISKAGGIALVVDDPQQVRELMEVLNERRPAT